MLTSGRSVVVIFVLTCAKHMQIRTWLSLVGIYYAVMSSRRVFLGYVRVTRSSGY
jgi:hypothetical protein